MLHSLPYSFDISRLQILRAYAELGESSVGHFERALALDDTSMLHALLLAKR